MSCPNFGLGQRCQPRMVRRAYRPIDGERRSDCLRIDQAMTGQLPVDQEIAKKALVRFGNPVSKIIRTAFGAALD